MVNSAMTDSFIIANDGSLTIYVQKDSIVSELDTDQDRLD